MFGHAKLLCWTLGFVALPLANASSLRGRNPGQNFAMVRRLILQKRTLPAYPFDRFQQWDSLAPDEQKRVTEALDYKKKTWNTPGSAEIEKLSFETINSTSLGLADDVSVGKSGLLTAIDVVMNTVNITVQDEWDCHVNHYIDYFWDELIKYGVVSYFEALGWTRELWDDEDLDTFPPSEEAYWYELTATEKLAAEAICYFPELWAGDVEIGQWLYHPPELAQAAGSASITNATNATNTTVDRRDIGPWDLPPIRFVLWKDLAPAQKHYATALGYKKETWNNPGTGIEADFKTYEDLSPAQVVAATKLGFDRFFWDCLIHHYENQAWNELAALGVQEFWTTLGWTYESWHGFFPPPASDNTTYNELSPEQQAAADQLCYLPETFLPGSQLSEIDFLSITPPPTVSPNPPV